MSSGLPMLRSDEIIRVLEKAGFGVIRQKGSHLRMTHSDGRVVTVPVHRGQDIGRGLLRKIMRDADMSRDDFLALLKR